MFGRIVDLSIVPTAVGKPFNDPVFALSKGALASLDERAEFDDEGDEEGGGGEGGGGHALPPQRRFYPRLFPVLPSFKEKRHHVHVDGAFLKNSLGPVNIHLDPAPFSTDADRDDLAALVGSAYDGKPRKSGSEPAGSKEVKKG